MPLPIDDLLIIDKLPDARESAIEYINLYIKHELSQKDEEKYTVRDEERIYKDQEKLRLIQLFKNDYEELQKAVKNNQFKNLTNIAEEFNSISSEFLKIYRIDADLSESKEAKTPEALLKPLKNQNVCLLELDLKEMKNYYTTEKMKQLMNQPIQHETKGLGPPILRAFVFGLMYANNGYDIYETINNQKNLRKESADFIYQAIQLLVKFGASIELETKVEYEHQKWFKKSLLKTVLEWAYISPHTNLDPLYKIFFIALIDAGADLYNEWQYPGTNLRLSILDDALTIYDKNLTNEKEFYFRYLFVECNAKPRQSTHIDSRIKELVENSQVFKEFYTTLQKERGEKETEYSKKKLLLTQSLFAFNDNKDLVNLCYEYSDSENSRAFIRSLKT